MRVRSRDPITQPYRPSAAQSAAGAASALDSAVAQGDRAAVLGVPEGELTPRVQQALASLMAEVDQLRGESERLRARLREIEALADSDPMLPVMNRRAFLREVGKALALAQRHGTPSAVLYFDLDRFKAINDAHGHAAGDAALKAVATTLSAHVRESDSVARLGGDEFGALLLMTGLEGAQIKGAALAQQIAKTPILWEQATLSLNVSWGAAALQPGLDPEAALAAVDAAMYARKAGRA